MTTPAFRVCQYHAPSKAAVERITQIRAATQNLIEMILNMCPPSPDRGAALRHARDAMMSANASIVVPQDDVVTLSRVTPIGDSAVLAGVDDEDDPDRPF